LPVSGRHYRGSCGCRPAAGTTRFVGLPASGRRQPDLFAAEGL